MSHACIKFISVYGQFGATPQLVELELALVCFVVNIILISADPALAVFFYQLHQLTEELAGMNNW